MLKENRVPVRIMRAMKIEQAITLVQNGETDAYRAIVDRYQAGVIIHCDNIVHDRDAAEDIAQTAFIKAYQSIDDYKPGCGAFSTWLYRIASNQAKDYLRQRKRTVNIDEIDSIPTPPGDMSSAERQEIRRAVSALQPPEYARVIEAYYWRGLRYDAIAHELDVPIATVGTWLSRAKNQLRKELS